MFSNSLNSENASFSIALHLKNGQIRSPSLSQPQASFFQLLTECVDLHARSLEASVPKGRRRPPVDYIESATHALGPTRNLPSVVRFRLSRIEWMTLLLWFSFGTLPLPPLQFLQWNIFLCDFWSHLYCTNSQNAISNRRDDRNICQTSQDQSSSANKL
jgi:hypothetical protein